MTDRLDIDRVSAGWQPFLTPRQTRIILDALEDYEPEGGDNLEACWKLLEWFRHEAAVHKSKMEAR